jgi:hypothetical protein
LVSLWDTDILLKLSALDLVQETLQLLQLSEQDVYLLPSATHYLRKADKRLIYRYGKEGVERAQKLAQQAKFVGFHLEKSELELLSSVPDIDTGEALLYASTYALQEFWLLTGDKRSLTALAASPNCQPIAARLSGKVICLEQVVIHSLSSHPFEILLSKIVPARECDTAVKVAFGSGNQADLSHAIGALDAYISELRAKTGNLLREW